jgi:hypothetical protein
MLKLIVALTLMIGHFRNKVVLILFSCKKRAKTASDTRLRPKSNRIGSGNAIRTFSAPMLADEQKSDRYDRGL